MVPTGRRAREKAKRTMSSSRAVSILPIPSPTLSPLSRARFSNQCSNTPGGRSYDYSIRRHQGFAGNRRDLDRSECGDGEDLFDHWVDSSADPGEAARDSRDFGGDL